MIRFAKTIVAGVMLMGTALAAQAQETFELTFSTYLPPTYEYVWKPVEAFVKTVEDKSDGRVKIKVFHSAQLFDGYDELQALSRGDIDITNMTGTYPSGTIPALTLFTLPFVFDDVAHMERALAAGLADQGMKQELNDKHDVVILGLAPWDPYEFYSRSTPILSESDFVGKVWATSGSSDAKAIQLLGGSPTGMPSSELYLSFDRGVIDGTPRPLLTGIGRSLYEVAKHLTISNFAIDTSILAINRQRWESLPADVQQIMLDAASERDRDQIARVRSFVEEAIAKYEEAGVAVHRMDAEAVSKLRQATKAAVDEFASTVENGEKYLEIIESTRNP
ncbi:ABC transporter substrate-binding protein [Pseudaminobacter arsenicus]|uniref:ABC transporter substrate-binding protein n=1 Tax=Borborobacter arsenicus TaxID=1851146 RepID=A0A432UZ57_9HYPH|nr:TRAP transporter substrate-binding protein DctP [Pseudaminobacter arsenicus]RUM95148.1 ABC transporter substrate-binding protein [Pseudaminobacter arsenicus]